LPSAQLARLIETLQGEMPETRIELVDGSQEQLHSQLAGRKLLACISLKSESEPGQRSVELLREDYGLVVGLNHRFASYESIQLSDLNGERFIVRTHCEAFVRRLRFEETRFECGIIEREGRANWYWPDASHAGIVERDSVSPVMLMHVPDAERAFMEMAGKRNFEGRDKAAETAVTVQKRCCRDRISLNNPHHALSV
jgi:DNA-binding transcriptional LysR family regulator